MINLTMPFFEGMGYSTVYPQEQPFTVEWIYTWEKHGHQRGVHIFSSEPGTRMILPSISVEQKDSPKLDEIDLQQFVLRDTAILDVPKGAEEVITAADIDKAMAKADVRQGDAILVRTGWGTEKRLMELGDKYELTSPYYSDEACVRLLEIMNRYKSNLFCYDVANCSDYTQTKATWCKLQPRPKSYVSSEAKAFLAEQDQLRHGPGPRRNVMRFFEAGIAAIGGMVNCTEISKPRFKLTALPFRIKGWGVAGCSAIGIED